MACCEFKIVEQSHASAFLSVSPLLVSKDFIVETPILPRISSMFPVNAYLSWNKPTLVAIDRSKTPSKSVWFIPLKYNPYCAILLNRTLVLFKLNVGQLLAVVGPKFKSFKSSIQSTIPSSACNAPNKDKAVFLDIIPSHACTLITSE